MRKLTLAEWVEVAELTAAIGVACGGAGSTSEGNSTPAATVAADYDDLLELFREFRSVETPTNDSGLPDYTVAAMARQRDQLDDMRAQVYVLEADAGGLAEGIEATVRVESRPGVDFAGRVTQVDALAKRRDPRVPIQYFGLKVALERTDPEVVDGFRSFDTPDMSDLMNRLYTVSSAIHNITAAHKPMLGPATTVKVFPGDNLMVHKALDIAQPGDVIIVDASSSLMTAVIGDLVCTKARHRGVVGFVIDGLAHGI